MNRYFKSFVLLCAVLLLGCRAGNPKPTAPAETPPKSPATGDRFELFSLAFEKDTSSNGFHDYRVLGRTVITDIDARDNLIKLMRASLYTRGSEMMCFVPRHGIREVWSNQVTDWVICFECKKAVVYRGDKPTSFFVSRKPEPEFDRLLQNANIPLAPKSSPAAGK